MLPNEIICNETSLLESAKQCGELLDIPVRTDNTSSEYLLFKDNHITFINEVKKQSLSFQHNFEANTIQRRLQSQDQHLLKAFKDKHKAIEDIIDVTAGWCRDSFILAENGYHVTAIEQSQLIYFLTQFSIDRYKNSHELTLKLINDNSFKFLRQVTEKPSAIYLDPMFPSNKNQAKNKKEIQILQAITSNQQIYELMSLALQTAKQRVVVKRPIRSEFLNQLKPDFQYKGKTIRFDVYQCT